MRRLLTLFFLLLVPGSGFSQSTVRAFENPSIPVEDRITDLLSRMTVEEKINALSTDPSVPRLGVVGTEHVEGLHGLALGGPGGWEGKGKPIILTTQFPQSRGLGQTWDPALLQQAAAVEAYETRYALGRYHRGGLVVRAPNADLSRDPRWGRSEESYGEDAFLTGTLAVSYIKGLQGDDPKYWMTSALMKHFLANSNENGRDGSSSDFDTRLFREYYSVPFFMGIEQGGSDAFMTAYNAWNNIPMTAQPVLRDVVMKDWKFDGIICTDAGALTNMVTEHRYSPNMTQAAAAAIHAGINQFLDDFRKPVQDALAQNLINIHDIDTNLRGVYRVMIKLGMLDPPSSVPYSMIGIRDVEKGDPWNWQQHKDVARKVTDESIVLLKNQESLLPLDASKLKTIAVIGPYADTVALDWYSGTPPYAISPLQGIQQRAGSAIKTQFASGNNLAEAASLAHSSDIAILVLGNHPTCNAGWKVCGVRSDGKEAVDRKTLTLEQEQIAKAVYAANPRTILVLNISFPFTTSWSQANIPSIVEMTHNSQEEGTGLADVLFGDYNPAGRLTQTWVASEDQLPGMMDYDIRHGRTYMYLKSKPLYAFGYGLSYTSFTYSNMRLSASTLHKGGSLQVSVDVKNTGQRKGDEVVQLYVTHIGSKVSRPIKELKAFARVPLNVGESKTVELTVNADSLRYWDESAHAFVLEPDKLEVSVGPSSDTVAVQKTIPVTE